MLISFSNVRLYFLPMYTSNEVESFILLEYLVGVFLHMYYIDKRNNKKIDFVCNARTLN